MSKTSRDKKAKTREETRLPHVFDLLWDYKTFADLDGFFAELRVIENKAFDIRRLLAEHGVKYKEPQP